mgnify:CR=1 FL=1
MIQRCAKTKRSGTANRLCVAKGTFLRLQLALLRWQFVRFCVDGLYAPALATCALLCWQLAEFCVM